MHANVDQFLRVEGGRGRVEFGTAEDRVEESYDVEDGWAIIVPAGVWHDVVNTGDEELRLYSLYAPPNHPDGAVHRTKHDAELAEAHTT
jgi:mannose-6-phosphate isomerase-like protein (cupin superfamily)